MLVKDPALIGLFCAPDPEGLHYNSDMRPILALETSTATCGVAVYSRTESSESLFFREISGVTGHSRNILPLVDEVLGEAHIAREELVAIAFGQGPGAFTGVRLACSVAQGMAFALQVPVVPVGALPALASSLEHDAGSMLKPAIRLVAIDARMNEIYLAAYVQCGSQPNEMSSLFELQSPVLMSAADCAEFVGARLAFWLRTFHGMSTVVLAGDGWQLVPPADLAALMAQTVQPDSAQQRVWVNRSGTYSTVRISDVARLGWDLFHRGRRVEPEQALPLYLRDKVAFTTAERALGLGGNPQAIRYGKAMVLPMSQVDLSEVVELEVRSQAFPWSERHFSDALSAGYPGWVLRESGELVGFCLAMATPDDVHLLVIAVSPDRRRQGLGALLLEQVYMFGRQQSVPRILLEVRPSNRNAIAFYDQQGFEQIGTRRGYYPAAKGLREDALVMARNLHGEQLSHG